MTPACTAPLSSEVLVAYWTCDLSEHEQDGVDEHLMGCASCTALSARLAQVSEALRALIPPIVTSAALSMLRKKGLQVLENPMLPGERREVTFAKGLDLLVHVLSGLELGQATRVDFVLSDEVSGRVLANVEDVPFERELGAILVACQRHYAVFPHNTVAKVRVATPSGDHSATYTILHHFM
jgi:hypothetical protein